MNANQIKIADDIINARIAELANSYVERIASLETLVVELNKHIAIRDTSIRTRGGQIDQLINVAENYRKALLLKDDTIEILEKTIVELKESVRLQSQIIAAKKVEIEIEQRVPWYKKLFA